jgi:hypothetical protein
LIILLFFKIELTVEAIQYNFSYIIMELFITFIKLKFNYQIVLILSVLKRMQDSLCFVRGYILQISSAYMSTFLDKCWKFHNPLHTSVDHSGA